ncbi:MAG: TIR domain-containing protein, partial [Prosthecobacter sp.]|uniref:TIR domain-containing protein n=1 Tax=Prosthecobacter sp. TaxID=1965333 RepID=UPI003BB103FE
MAFNYDVFLSYSKADQIEATAIAEKLASHNIRVWLDEWGLYPKSGILRNEMNRALNDSHKFLALWSNNYLNSQWAKSEIKDWLHNSANNNRRNCLLILNLDGSQVDSTLSRFEIDWMNGASFYEVLNFCQQPEEYNGPDETSIDGRIENFSNENLLDMQSQEDKLRKIVLPTVQFSGATLEEAIEYLRIKSIDYDSPDKSGYRRGVSFRVDEDLLTLNASLNLDLKNVPLIKALEYITELTGVDFEIGPEEIRIRKKIDSITPPVGEHAAESRKQNSAPVENSSAAVSRAQAEGDNPSTTDHFGREKFVETLAYFLTRPKTGTPLTVSIEAPWGGGKTSFMRQLSNQVSNGPESYEGRNDLMERLKCWLKNNFTPHTALTMWFNPWRHAEAEAMWAAFALEFANSVRRQSIWTRRWFWAPLCLWFQSYDWSKGFPEVIKFALRIAIFIFTCWACTWFWSHGREAWADISSSVTQWNKLSDNQRTASALTEKLFTGENGKLIVVIITGIGLMVQLSSALGNPLLPAIKQYLSKKGAADKLGYVEGFQRQFGQMVRAYAGNRRVFVFVDDLDRCEAAKAASLMQSINLMLGDPDLNAVFLLGMDREKVAAGMALKHADLLPFLTARELLVQLEDNNASPKNIEALQHLLGL